MRALYIFLFCLFLTACGGSGDSASPQTPIEGDGATPVSPSPAPPETPPPETPPEAPPETPPPEAPPPPEDEPTPMGQESAALFLMQSTFGPTLQSIEYAANIDRQTWLAEQFNTPASLHLPLLSTKYAADEMYSQHWVESWWDRVVNSDDQLRQRVAFALSQIFVVSTKDDRLLVDPLGVANYYDVLVRNSFGNFRTLLEEVTLNPMMGMYLSMLGNERPDDERNIRPDENFAREVMQLFTIGLVELNPDGTVKRDAAGNTIATYGQDEIEGFAHVFTGWHFAGKSHWWEWHYDSLTPMSAYNAFHDDGEKVLLNGTVLPAGQSAEQDLRQALDNLFHHPNVGPFISKQLIQRLVSSNPSPQYVARVSQVFNDNGDGVRGDLQAVVQAILLDEEAVTLSARQTGKLRMPLLRLAHTMRAFNSGARDNGMGHEFVEYNLGLSPLGSPSVFNFYRPDYSLPGDIRDSGLTSPEFQLENEISVTRYINYMFYMAWFNNLRGDEIVEDDVGIVNFDQLVALQSDDAIIEYINLVLFAGQMNDETRQALHNAAEHWSGAEVAWMKYANLVYLATISPEFAVQP